MKTDEQNNYSTTHKDVDMYHNFF